MYVTSAALDVHHISSVCGRGCSLPGKLKLGSPQHEISYAKGSDCVSNLLGSAEVDRADYKAHVVHKQISFIQKKVVSHKV